MKNQDSILIFGSSGQIGRSLIRKFTKNNYKVIAVTRSIHRKGYQIKTQSNYGYLELEEINSFNEHNISRLMAKVLLYGSNSVSGATKVYIFGIGPSARDLFSIYSENDNYEIFSSSGPYAFTDAYFSLSEEVQKKGIILPSNYFYPFPNFLISSKPKNFEDFITKESIGLHHWEMSWMKKNIFFRIIKKLISIFKRYFN